MMSATNWKIADSLFYPLGLFNNSCRSKIVFVTWTFDCLFTYIFKKTGDTTSLKDTYKIVLKDTIHDIVVTEYNTLVLMRNGQLYYFSSCRNLRKLKFLSGIKCITSRQEGFALIRINETNAILLEIFQDFSDPHEAESRRKKSFDISFDELNIFNSSWKDERFSVLPVRIKEGNKRFFHLLAKKDIESDEIYFFSISNNLFCLLPRQNEEDEDICEISLITIMTTQIESIKLMQSINAILIFLSCGAIEIIFFSRLLNMLDRMMHVTGPDVITSTFESDCFYYSDGETIVKAEITYDAKEHICVVHEHSKHIPNIVALTLVKSTQTLVCLSENNIFYTTKFTQVTSGTPSNEEFFELNDNKLAENEQYLNQIVDLIEEPRNIYKQIEREVQKQEVIIVTKRRDMYSNVVSAIVSFYSCIPEIRPATFVLNENSLLQKDHYFVLITFNVVWNELFQNGLWSLIINFASCLNTTWTLKIDKSVIKNEFNVLVPVRKEQFVIPPSIIIELASFVNVDREFLYVSLPVNFKNYHFYNLFTAVPARMEESGKKKISKLDRMLCDLAEKSDPLQGCELSEKKFCVKIRTPLIMSIDDLYEMFNMRRIHTDDVIEVLDLYFLGEKVVVTYVETQNYVQIKTEDPIALFYTKLIITKGLSSEYYDDEPVNVRAAERPLSEIQCQVEGRYGGGYSDEIYAASLSRLYIQLRHDTIKQF